MNERCLYCYQPLEENEVDFHLRCSKRFFGTPTPPELDYTGEQMQELAQEIVVRSVAVTGVQPKLSLTLEITSGDPKRSRFTIVGLWGSFILKPPTPEFPHLPENEDLTMHLSAVCKIPTADHTLIRLKSGELAYLTKRFDRENGKKLALEDTCQLTETLTTDKYHSSMERVGKAISRYSMQPGIDASRFFELTLFSFLTGNADMHLKNFSLLTDSDNIIQLAPAYDLLSTKLAIPDDKEEMALTLNGRKAKLARRDFDALAEHLKLSEKITTATYLRFTKLIPKCIEWIDISFLTTEDKQAYRELLLERTKRLALDYAP